MIGVDPHQGSHTAVALGADEAVLGQLRVRVSAAQAERLVRRSWTRCSFSTPAAATTNACTDPR
jgi:hypothetical protein